jgi:hypothetical protein
MMPLSDQYGMRLQQVCLPDAVDFAFISSEKPDANLLDKARDTYTSSFSMVAILNVN